MIVTPAQHLLAWFTPERRKLINSSALDRQAKRPIGNFSRFLAAGTRITFEHTDLTCYYPVLQLIGYLPPIEFWTPARHLKGAERSTNIRRWLTPERRDLINFRQLDALSNRPLGVFSRYLNNEPHLTFKIIGLQVYYPMLELLGYVPPTEISTKLSEASLSPAAQHLLTWCTPERRGVINAVGIDHAAGQQAGCFARLLAGQPLPAGVEVGDYYTIFRLLGYRPDLDLSQDEGVQRHRLEQPEAPE